VPPAEVRPDRHLLPAIEIQVGAHAITAAEPLPDDARETLDRIHRHTGALFERTRAPAERSSVVFVVPGF
jgi:hypothetical protein